MQHLQERKLLMKKRQMAFYLFPALLLTLVFFIFPFGYLCYISFFKWNGLGPMEFTGLANFKYVLTDPVFQTAFRNTLIWIGSALFLHIPFGILLALLLNRKPKGWKFFRVLYFIPNVISTTAIAFLWYFIYHVDVGLLNNILRNIGLPSLAKPWLNNIQTALAANQVPFIIYVGLTMIIFITQLSTIPKELYEAAEVDGATNFQKDIHICLPMLKPAIITNILLNTAFCLRTFEYPFLMTGGGPANQTTNLSLYIYKEMVGANRYGVSMVAGIITVFLGLAIMLIVQLLKREKKGARI